MRDYNFKVVAKFKADVPEERKQQAVDRINEIKEKLHIINIDENTYRKAPPIKDYNDFGAMGILYFEMEDFKDCFSALEFYNYWRGTMDCAV